METPKEFRVSIFSSFAFFHLSYLFLRTTLPLTFPRYKKLEKDEKGYFCASCVGIMHAILISYMTIRCLIDEPKLLQSQSFFYNTPLSEPVVGTFLGYIASDMILTMYYRSRWNGWVENLMHHLVILVCYSDLYVAGVGAIVITPSLLCELSTPFVNLRWMLYVTGQKNTRTYFLNGLALTFTWFVTRILWYSFLGFKVFLMRDQIFSRGMLQGSIFMFSYFTGLTLQYFWFSKILRGSIRVLFPPKPKDIKIN